MHGTWPKANAQFWRDKIETNRRRDADTDERLRQAEWRVVRVWEHEAPSDAADRVQSVVEGRRRELSRSIDRRDMVKERAADDLTQAHGDGVADESPQDTEPDRVFIRDESIVLGERLEDSGLP